jgi:predicted DNA-binding protein with PD1-like motif
MEKIISEIGKGEKIVIIRIQPKADLFEGIKIACNKHNVRSGVISACFGSLEKLFLTYYYPPRDYSKNQYGEERHLKLEMHCSILTAQGMVCRDKNGEIAIHMHGVVRGLADGIIYGGHFNDKGNIAKNTIEVAIIALSEIHLLRVWDEQTGHVQLWPQIDK